jgi:hypothetical protein
MPATSPATGPIHCVKCHGARTAATLNTGSGHHYRCCDCLHTWFEPSDGGRAIHADIPPAAPWPPYSG